MMEPLDPYAILRALTEARVEFVLVGALARVARGSSELADEVEVCAAPERPNLLRLDAALRELAAGAHDGTLPAPVRFATPHGRVVVRCDVPGLADYRRLVAAARAEPLGEGLRVRIATGAELLRQLGELADPELLRHALEIDVHTRTIDRSLELGL